jgi:hypothetical protein
LQSQNGHNVLSYDILIVIYDWLSYSGFFAEKCSYTILPQIPGLIRVLFIYISVSLRVSEEIREDKGRVHARWGYDEATDAVEKLESRKWGY